MRLIATGPQDYLDLRESVEWRGWQVPPGGVEPVETLEMLSAWSARLHRAQGWGTWLAVEGGEVVASLAVKEPLSAGLVEIGYGVAPARRGAGVATRAVLALCPVLAGHGVGLVSAATARDNPASARVLLKAGFVRCGERTDPEDGLLDLWQCRLTIAI